MKVLVQINVKPNVGVCHTANTPDVITKKRMSHVQSSAQSPSAKFTQGVLPVSSVIETSFHVQLVGVTEASHSKSLLVDLKRVPYKPHNAFAENCYFAKLILYSLKTFCGSSVKESVLSVDELCTYSVKGACGLFLIEFGGASEWNKN